jgi:DNA/RNA endonuclease YhcR with UshA esterase domain
VADCPSCGRYTEPAERCPHCGARLTGRIRLNRVRWVVLASAVLGVAGLWFVARGAQAPLVTLGQAGATMNTALVRVYGRCVRGPDYDSTSGALSFWLDDGTGQAYVAAYGEVAQALIASGQVPALGDSIEVEGTLRVRPERLALTLLSPDGLEIERPPAVERAIGSLTAADLYGRVRVRGQVRALREPYPGLTLVTLRDATGSVPIALSRELFVLSGVTPTLVLGQALDVEAAVSLYRDSVQLLPACVDDLTVLEDLPVLGHEVPIAALSAAQAGQMAAVRGRVTAVEPFSAGTRATLDDGTGTLTLLLWDTLVSSLPDRGILVPGATLWAQGEVSVYAGELELVPDLPGDMQLLATPAPSATPIPTRTPLPTPSRPATVVTTPTVAPLPTLTHVATPTLPAATAVTLIPIGALTAARPGDVLTVEGVVVGTASFSRGFKFLVEDGSGQIVLLLWHEVYDDCWDAPRLNLGAQVRATGQIADYQGERQLQPFYGSQVQILREAAPWAEPRAIGSLSGADVGTRVMIEGVVLRVGATSGGAGVSLGDESGEVVVYLWRNVLDRVRNNAGLGTPGSRVRVVGSVELYRSNLQVVPALPADVIVLEVAP